MSVMEICIIRHGKTEANEKRLYCGKTDIELSTNGIEEILSLKNKNLYNDVEYNVFYTSGLKRANQTLSHIFGDVNSTAVSELEEYNFGDFEMKSYEELKDDKDYIEWITDESTLFLCRNGENKTEFKNRVLDGFNNIVNTHKGSKDNIFIVCHGGVIANIMEFLYPNINDFYTWQPSSGLGYRLFFDDNKLTYKKTEDK